MDDHDKQSLSLPLTATTEDAQLTPRSCRSSCQRRYPRLVSNLFWLYLLVEGLCFVVDIAFLSTTVMAARNGSLLNGTSVLGDDEEWDNSTNALSTEPGASGTELDWNTFQTLLLQQWQLQFDQQEAFVRKLLHVGDPAEEEKPKQQTQEESTSHLRKT